MLRSNNNLSFICRRFDSVQRDHQWRHRIDREEGAVSKEKRVFRNPITGEGFKNKKTGKPRPRQENHVLLPQETARSRGASRKQMNETLNSARSNSSYRSAGIRKSANVKKKPQQEPPKSKIVPGLPIMKLTQKNLEKMSTSRSRKSLKRGYQSSRSSRRELSARTSASSIGLSSLKSGATTEILNRIERLERVLEEEREKRIVAEEALSRVKNNNV